MSVISNQLSYTPIQPPVEPKNTYPVLAAVVQRVAYAVLIGGFFSAFGVAIAISFKAALLDSTITSGIIGIIFGLPFVVFANLPTAVESYRQGCLEEIEKGMSNPRAITALRNLKSFFYYPLNRFSYYHQLPLLYNEIAAVTEKLDPERKDVVEAWVNFLKNLNGLKAKMPGGEEVQLDFLNEFSKMQGRRVQVSSSWLTTRFSVPDRSSLVEIENIQKQTMGRFERLIPSDMAYVLNHNRDSHVVVSRDSATQEIVGYGWYFEKEPNVIEIQGIARKPSYARLGIGSELLLKMLAAFDQSKEVQLYVRASNPAQNLYKEWGFEPAGIMPGYYSYDPKEDGVLMKINWEKYNKAVSRQ